MERRRGKISVGDYGELRQLYESVSRKDGLGIAEMVPVCHTTGMSDLDKTRLALGYGSIGVTTQRALRAALIAVGGQCTVGRAAPGYLERTLSELLEYA